MAPLTGPGGRIPTAYQRLVAWLKAHPVVGVPVAVLMVALLVLLAVDYATTTAHT